MYCEVFGVTGYRQVSAVTDTKLVAEAFVPKELGKGVPAVTVYVKAHVYSKAKVKRKQIVEVCASFAVLL
jgi:hypothetical protein